MFPQVFSEIFVDFGQPEGILEELRHQTRFALDSKTSQWVEFNQS